MNNIVKSTSRINKILIGLIVILLFITRPFAFGAEYSIYGYSLILFFALIINSNTKKDIFVHGKVCSVILVYYFIELIFNPSIKFALVLLVDILVVFWLFSNSSIIYYFFKYFKNLILLLVILGIINFILDLTYGYEKLLWIENIQLFNGTYSYDLFYPFTLTSMLWPFPPDVPIIGGLHPRQYYWFLEPGMVPPFFISLIYIIWNTPQERQKVFQIVLLSIGILLTYSTGGPLMFFLSISVYYFFSRKKKFTLSSLLIAAVLLGIAYYAYNYMPFFGKQDKINLSAGTAESVATHETIPQYVLIGGFLLIAMGYHILKYKKKKAVCMTIASLMFIGYFSNYIGYTLLATMFYFWDIPVDNNGNKAKLIT